MARLTRWRMLRRMVDALVTGKRRRGRQKTRRKDFCNRDMESVCLKVEDVMDGQIARPKPKTILATPDDGETLRMRTDMTVSGFAKKRKNPRLLWKVSL